MKVWLLVLALGALLALAIFGALAAWARLGAVPISGHGLIALGLGLLFTLGLGIGLMALAFYSNRHGHDDRAGRRRGKQGGPPSGLSGPPAG